MSANLVRENLAESEYEKNLLEREVRIKESNGEIKRLQNEL